MKSEQEILAELRRAIAKDAETVNPDTPEMVYDCIELEKLLKSKERDFRETLAELSVIKGKYSQLRYWFERYLEFLIYLEGNIRVLGTSDYSSWGNQDDPFNQGLSPATHKEKFHIAERLILQINEIKRKLYGKVFPHPEESEF